MIIIAGEYQPVKNKDQTLFVNKKTGEIFDSKGQSVFIQSVEERQQIKNHFINCQIKEEKKKYIERQYKEYGNFVWMVYSMLQCNFLNISPSNLTRLMFISTYLGYKGYLQKSRNTFMNKDDVFEILKLSTREFNRFYTEMFDNKILCDKQNKIFLNNDIFIRGNIKAKQVGQIYQQEQMITRIYIKAIRELYNKATPRSHKTLSYIFQAMPYVNRDYNMCCFNPLETNIYNIKLMNLGQFCDIIGYDKNNSKRLLKILFEPKFQVDNREESAMNYVIKHSLDQTTYGMFINPRVYYAGNKWNEIKVLCEF